ncbi:MAG: cytidylate kinase-like family protein [Muribaculaceae bacterium]|nr:cytidylate kinase-like family protein [Muribaculaceae bacterium]
MGVRDKVLPEKYVITVGRSFGSGGRILAKIIADKLGIAFYDRELLIKAAEKAGMSPEYFERNDERVPRFFSGLFSFNHGYSPMSFYAGTSSITSDGIYQAQCDFMHDIADAGPCVIVGRSADYVLRDVENVVNIFVHAPMKDCVKRILDRADRLTEDDARSLAERTNKVRAAFYNFYTDKRWGAASSYDITVNSSLLPLEECADFVIDYLYRRIGKEK